MVLPTVEILSRCSGGRRRAMPEATPEENVRAFTICCLFVSCLCFLPAAGAHAEDESQESGPVGKSHWAVLAGYGVTHTSIGMTRAHVETVDFVFRYGRYLTDEIGRSWYRFRHVMLIEVPVHVVVDPNTSPMIGINFLANFTFTAMERVQPYVLGGGGFIYTDADIPGLGSKYNGDYQAGVGILYRLGTNYSLNAEYRYHHISNFNTKEPNDPLNSSKFLIGVTSRF
jgi:lipid A 3-O-deacylase